MFTTLFQCKVLYILPANENPITFFKSLQHGKERRRKIFDNKKVRTVWDEDNEQWYIAIVDVVAALTDSPNPQVYWRVLKKRLKDEGNETVTNCNGLKMLAPDGKMRMTDVADTEQ